MINNKERIIEIVNKENITEELVLELEYLLKLEAYRQYEMMIKKLPLYGRFNIKFDDHIEKFKNNELELEDVIKFICEWSMNNKNYYSIGGEGFEKLGISVVGN